MKVVTAIYRLFNLLSVDISVGAVIGSLFLAKQYGVDPSPISLILLALTVWLIYTADRLLDVNDAKGLVSSERHQFHKANKKALCVWLCIIGMIELVLVFFVPYSIVKRGIFLSVIVIVYIVLRRRLHLFKEFFVAVLYTAGVAIPALPELPFDINSVIPLILFFFIALINLIIFSLYEREDDLRVGQVSIATMLESESMKQVIAGLFIVSLTIVFYMIFWLEMYLVSMVFFVMLVILWLIYWQRDWFKSHNRYRWIGDAIFFLPVLYLLK